MRSNKTDECEDEELEDFGEEEGDCITTSDDEYEQDEEEEEEDEGDIMDSDALDATASDEGSMADEKTDEDYSDDEPDDSPLEEDDGGDNTDNDGETAGDMSDDDVNIIDVDEENQDDADYVPTKKRKTGVGRGESENAEQNQKALKTPKKTRSSKKQKTYEELTQYQVMDDPNWGNDFACFKKKSSKVQDKKKNIRAGKRSNTTPQTSSTVLISNASTLVSTNTTTTPPPHTAASTFVHPQSSSSSSSTSLRTLMPPPPPKGKSKKKADNEPSDTLTSPPFKQSMKCKPSSQFPLCNPPETISIPKDSAESLSMSIVTKGNNTTFGLKRQPEPKEKSHKNGIIGHATQHLSSFANKFPTKEMGKKHVGEEIVRIPDNLETSDNEADD
ncbi:hypothetical protein EGW08_020747, partial [Elysia chlorotica]